MYALENQSTTTRMVVNPCEFGRSVTKSTAMWDQGQHDVGSGSRSPAGCCHFEHV